MALVDAEIEQDGRTKRQPTKLSRLSSLGLTAPWQLPLLLPVRHMSFAFPAECLADFSSEERRITTVTITRTPSVRWPARSARGRRPWRVLGVELASGEAAGATIFGDTRDHADRFLLGKQVTVLASFRHDDRGAWLTLHEVMDNLWPGRIMPIYGAAGRSMSSEDVRESVLDSLPAHLGAASAYLRKQLVLVGPIESVLRELGADGWSVEQLIEQCHLPVSMEHGKHALQVLRRIAALLALHEIRTQPRRPAKAWTLPSLPRRIAQLPLRLTDDQRRAVAEIAEMLSRPVRGHQMLCGEPGSGKTLPALILGAAICDAGGRVVLLEPTAKLAGQLARDLQRWFPDVPAGLVTRESNVPDGEARFLIGTTALLHRDLGWTPDLVIVDEQQRYAVHQREQLARHEAHLLEMTATPIPRTTALLNMGRIGYSRLVQTHAPKTITTRLYEGPAEIRACFADVAHKLRAGERLLVVYPLRGEATDPEESEGERSPDTEEERLAVASAVRRWERHAPGRVGALTSRDDETAAQDIIDRLNEGTLQVLVATTCVDVGINLTELHQIVIVSPERHGLLQLHQLRGRLAREGGSGHCALVCIDPLNDVQRGRLGMFARTQDGFALADIDLAMRGAGDIRDLSKLQSGPLQGCIYGTKLSMQDLADATEVLDAISPSERPEVLRRCS